MGKKSSPAPAPAPPPEPVAVPTQSLQTQTALAEVSGAQSRLNMTLGAQLDQRNKEFFTTQDIRQTQTTGAETRLTLGTQGEQERATIGARGEQERLGYQTQGEQASWLSNGELSTETRGEQERLGYQTQGEQQRLTIGTTGKETRKTNLQQNMQQNYVMGRQYDWAQDAYRVGGPKVSQPSSAQPGLVE
jgi:hypothetical protein